MLLALGLDVPGHAVHPRARRRVFKVFRGEGLPAEGVDVGGGDGQRSLERAVRDEEGLGVGFVECGEKLSHAFKLARALGCGERGEVKVFEGVHEDAVAAVVKDLRLHEADKHFAPSRLGKTGDEVVVPAHFLARPGTPGLAVDGEVPFARYAAAVAVPPRHLEHAEVTGHKAALRLERGDGLGALGAKRLGVDDHEVVAAEALHDVGGAGAIVEAPGPRVRERAGRRGGGRALFAGMAADVAAAA